MNICLGIVGLPNVGKSTLFKLLTKQEVHIANYPFATIDPNVGVVAVPDERLDKLAAMSRSKKIVPAVVEFYDIAGLVKGAHQGEGLGNQFLSHIREVDAIAHILRCFKDERIVHVEVEVDPLRDMDIVHAELIQKDLETVKKRLDKLEGEARTGDAKKAKECEIVRRVEAALGEGTLAAQVPSMRGEPVIRELNLLTMKPQFYVLNGDGEDVPDALKERIRSLGSEYCILNLNTVGGVGSLIARAYDILGLMSFLTTGEDETRSWTIARGTKMPQAAGVIHTDFEKKFIKAEVISWEKLLGAGSWSRAKEKGLIRLEGKEYTVQDGDVAVIKHG